MPGIARSSWPRHRLKRRTATLPAEGENVKRMHTWEPEAEPLRKAARPPGHVSCADQRTVRYAGASSARLKLWVTACQAVLLLQCAGTLRAQEWRYYGG